MMMWCDDFSIKLQIKRLKTNLIHGQLDLSSERHQGTDNSQDPEQEQEHGGATASYSFQLDDAQGQDLERDKHSGTGRLNLRIHMQLLQHSRGSNFAPELESREPKLKSVMPRFYEQPDMEYMISKFEFIFNSNKWDLDKSYYNF